MPTPSLQPDSAQLSPSLQVVEDALRTLSERNPRGAFLGRQIAPMVDLLEEEVYSILESMATEGLVERIQPIREPAPQSRWSLPRR